MVGVLCLVSIVGFSIEEFYEPIAVQTDLPVLAVGPKILPFSTFFLI